MKRQSGTSLIISIFLSIILTVSSFNSALGMSIKEEKDLSREVLKYVNDRFEMINDPIINEYINQLGNKILKQAPPQPFDYRFYIIQEEIYNAFATPAGHIFIHSGLFADFSSEAELAGILAHEISHVVCRHISKRIKAAKKVELATLAGAVAGIFLGASGSLKEGTALTMSSIASGQSFMLAYSRENEIQADQIGLEYLNQAGYSAKGLLKALERITSQQLFGSNQIPTYLKTHPASEERMANMDTWIQGREKIDLIKINDESAFQKAQVRYFALYSDEMRAEQKLSTMLKQDPKNKMVHYGYGLLLDRKGKYTKALTHFRKALEKDALNPSFLEALGQTYFNAGNYEKAIASLKIVLDIKPKSPLAMYYYGRSLLSKGDYKGAIKMLDGFIRLDPGHTKAHYFLGQAHNKSGDAFHSHYYLGLYYYKKRDFKNSTFHLKKAQAFPEQHSKGQLIKALIKKSTYHMKRAPRKKKR